VNAQQPNWKNAAERVVTLQRKMQAVSPALLAPLRLGNRSFVLKEIQPSEDRLALAAWEGKFRRLENVVISMGGLVASSHLRTAAWRGAASRDELRDFAIAQPWKRELTQLANSVKARIGVQWKQFSVAYDQGRLH
jgi:uncharacterized protein (DUF2252 family)